MGTHEQIVTVTLPLPQDRYDRVRQAAASEQRSLEDVLSRLVSEGLDAHITTREVLERVSAQYRDRLSRERKSHQSSDEVLEELRALREQIAGELYSE
jgi:hypothetical protein